MMVEDGQDLIWWVGMTHDGPSKPLLVLILSAYCWPLLLAVLSRHTVIDQDPPKDKQMSLMFKLLGS